NDIERPVLVDIRVRKSKHGGESVTISRSAAAHHRAPAKQSGTTPEQAQRPAQRKETPTQKREVGGLFKKVFGSGK
ncbi:MAG: ATPase, partial [Methanosarcinales archaeon]|nr:ATPase [Methanosarcinales archaeon]MCD4814948.1 ATPase [Methanosarcinales archaeon]